MSPTTFINEFPKATHNKYIAKSESKIVIANGSCKTLVENRKYVAPIGLTVHGDVSNAANGVDEWVTADKGNAYIVNNFEWISVGNEGNTQLIIYFNTLYCS